MINLNNLLPKSSWPAKGFLAGGDLLSKEMLSTIQSFDFDQCETRDVYRHERRTKEFHMGNTFPHADPASIALQQLVDYLGPFEVLESLLERAFVEPQYNIDRFWSGGIQGLRARYKGAGLSINEDRTFSLSPHSDTRVVIANIQIYLNPEDNDMGTRFHEYGNHAVYEQLPFVPNTGYFLLNTEHGAHSVVHATNVPRRSILFGWMI